MYKKACCTCKLVVLLNNPIVFLTFSLPSPSSFLKLPTTKSPTPAPSVHLKIKMAAIDDKTRCVSTISWKNRGL